MKNPNSKIENKLQEITNPQISEYLNQKEKDLGRVFNSSGNQIRGLSNWITIFLLISIVFLGSYMVLELSKSRTLLQNLDQKGSVAGVNQNTTKTTVSPISGAGFSILPQTKTPDSLKTSQQITDSTIFTNRKAVISTLSIEENYQGQQLKSKTIFEILEYDNQMNQEQFTNKILEKLGSEYQVVAKDVTTAKDYKLWKINSKTSSSNKTDYYTLVSTNNYYLITQDNEMKNLSNFKDINEFVGNMLTWAYLN